MTLTVQSSTSGFGALLASLKFGMRRSKHDLTTDVTLPTPPPSSKERRHLSLDFSAAEHKHFLDDLIEFQQIETEVKKRSLGIKVRRRSFSKKHSSTYNVDESLHNAVMVGNVELTRQVLLDENIDVNALRPPGWTALHHACRIGNVKLIKMLVDAGSDTTLLNNEGSTPLRIAVTQGHFDAASYLIHDGGVSCKEIRDGFQGMQYRSQSLCDNKGKLRKMKSFDT